MMRPSVSHIDPLAIAADAEGPRFNEPWEAQAFALAVHLSECGYFTWPEWTEVLNQEIRAAQARGDADLGHTYYHHWLRALERLCANKGLVDSAERSRRKAEWRRAYLNTPHGDPIDLSAAFKTKNSTD